MRPATANDLPFLRQVCYEAAFWNLDGERPDFDTALADPQIGHYVDGFRRPGDFGLIAETEDREPLGAAWFRFFTEEQPAYGFVAADVPEITIAVIPAWRGQGLGRRLLEELLSCAHEAGLGRVSLSVSRANPALRLYRRLGFVRVSSEGGSDTMVVNLSATI